MTCHLTQHRDGFPIGWTTVTREDEPHDNTGIRFSILKLSQGAREILPNGMELALLHLAGTIAVTVEDQQIGYTRNSVFDDSPFAVHIDAETSLTVQSDTDSEVAIFQTPNTKTFPAAIYRPDGMFDEPRGKGLVAEASLRFVRTIFDGSNSHPNTELVLGEVVNFPGRWSSYPPHHHPQPEIYHYRFTHPQGYGHAELGDAVCKVRQNDTVKILDEVDHSQCSAPGYGMYYIWVIRHLSGCRYTVPEFTEAHRWTMDPSALVWAPAAEVLA